MASLPQMPDVAGESKAAAEKAAKAAQEAAAEAARKSKEAYDLVIPAEIDWCALHAAPWIGTRGLLSAECSHVVAECISIRRS